VADRGVPEAGSVPEDVSDPAVAIDARRKAVARGLDGLEVAPKIVPKGREKGVGPTNRKNGDRTSVHAARRLLRLGLNPTNLTTLARVCSKDRRWNRLTAHRSHGTSRAQLKVGVLAKNSLNPTRSTWEKRVPSRRSPRNRSVPRAVAVVVVDHVREGNDRASRWNCRNEWNQPMRAASKTNLETNFCPMMTQARNRPARVMSQRIGHLAAAVAAGGVRVSEVRVVKVPPRSR